MSRKRTPQASSVRRAIGYVRISVDREDETSTDTQEERVRAYCIAQGWEVVDVIVEAGRSAFKASRSSRPGFRQVIDTLRAGAADALVVWKLDRAARDTVDTLNLVTELEALGARFASVTEHFDTSTPTGRLTMTMLAALAEMESATKSDRVQEWQNRRRLTGATPTGPRPFGYQRGGKDNPNMLTLDEAEAIVVREAAALVLDGTPLRQIVRQLAKAGAVGKSGKPISHRALRAILVSPTVAACREVEPGVFVGSDAWKPILDRSTWDEVRAVLTDPSRRSGPGSARRWLLSGIAVCGRDGCGTPMAAKPHLAGPRYVCPTCYLSIEAGRTDELVERDLLALLDADTWRQLRRGRTSEPETSSYDEAMAELVARFSADDLDAVAFADLAEGLRRQRDAATVPPPALPDVANLRKAWPTLDVEQRRLVIGAATESLMIKPWTPGVNRFDESRVVFVPTI